MTAALTLGAAWAATPGGGEAGAWMGLGGGARPAALGNAFAALADDPSAVFYNPAGLDQREGAALELTFQYPFSDVEDIYYANGAAAYSLAGRGYSLGTFAAGINYFKASGIEEAGPLGLTGRTFSDYEMALDLAWGKGLGGNVVAGDPPHYYFGLAAKVVSTKVYDYSDGGFGVDAGFLFRPLPAIRVGVSLTNIIAPNIELVDTRDSYPATARVAAAYDFSRNFLATFETRVRKDGDAGVAVGGEAAIKNLLALRGGYEYPANRPAAGMGVRFGGRNRFDFTWRPHEGLGDSYIATAGMTF